VPDDPFDARVPSIARMYDYWLGGTDNFGADRAAAAEVEKVFPGTRLLAVRSRQFLVRAVTWLAQQQGVTRFMDLGAGIPTRGEAEISGRRVRIIPVHEAALAACPSARIAYADADPCAVAHASAMAAGPGVAAVRADVTDAASVLADPRVREVTGAGGPSALIFGMILHFMPAETARALVAEYARAVRPSSYVVISVARSEDTAMFGQVRELVRRCGAELYNHSPDDVRSFFAGLDMVPPGVVPARAWRAGWQECLEPDGAAYVLAGAGRVPRR